MNNIIQNLQFIKPWQVDSFFDNPALDMINDENRIEIVKFVTKISYTLDKLGYRPPSWIMDDRLRLNTPYLGLGYKESWFLYGPQAFYRHNCFFDPEMLEAY